MTETPRTTNSVKVGLGVLRKVKVDDNIDRLNVNATREEVGADKVAAYAVSKIMEDAVTVMLKHSGMRIEA